MQTWLSRFTSHRSMKWCQYWCNVVLNKLKRLLFYFCIAYYIYIKTNTLNKRCSVLKEKSEYTKWAIRSWKIVKRSDNTMEKGQSMICQKWPRIYVVVITIRFFPHSWLITGSVTSDTWRLLEHELLTLPVNLRSSRIVSGVLIAWSLVVCVVFCRSLIWQKRSVTEILQYTDKLLTRNFRKRNCLKQYYIFTYSNIFILKMFVKHNWKGMH
jgi:hypothetical protein